MSANYRFGVFGFMFSNSLQDRIAPEHGIQYYDNLPVSGNQGLMDQQMAMIWTRENCAYFGGNKEKITLGGMSAGAQSLHAHLVMHSSKELFQQAVAFSGPQGIPYYNAEEGELITEGIAYLTNCCEGPFVPGIQPRCNPSRPIDDDVIDCMKRKSTEEIQEAAWKLVQAAPIDNFKRLTMIAEPYSPIIGTGMLKEMPFFHFQRGEIHNKPIIIDVADNEGWKFVEPVMFGLPCENNNSVCDESWDRLKNFLFSEDDAAKIDESGIYNCPADGSECVEKVDEFLTDFTWYCNMQKCVTDGISGLLLSYFVVIQVDFLLGKMTLCFL